MSSSPALDPGYTTTEMAGLWTISSRVDAILHFESALALALAEAGVAPQAQAEAVAAACAEPLDDPGAAWASTWETGTPLLNILEVVGSRLAGNDARRWLHHGSTTQDAVDTAHMLQAASSLSLLGAGMGRIAATLLALMEAHRELPEMGRTFLQHARPTTFGMRVARWLETMLGHIEELRAIRSELPVQLGGPVGDRADYGAHSQEIVEHLARRLELAGTALSWHTDRSPIWKLVDSVDRAVRSMAKISMDVALLASSDIGEVEVRAGGSSSIADKRNPLDAIRALAAADACRGAVAMINGGRPHELDRGLGSWHVEWFALPILFQTAAAVSEAVESLFENLEVDTASSGSIAPGPAMEALDTQMDGVAARFRQIVGD